MKKRNVITALAAAAMVLQLVEGFTAAQAQATEVEFSFSPRSGVPGTKINFQGTGCPHVAGAAFDGVFALSNAPDGAGAPFVADAAGNFSGQYDTAGHTPRGYTTVVSCFSNDKDAIGETFTVTEGPPVGSKYFPIAPVRVLDTREGRGTGGVVDPVGPNEVLDLQVTGVAGVPTSGVTAIALNVTVTEASGPESHLRVWPTGASQPQVSNLNFSSGVSVPNLVIVRVGAGGKVSLRNNVGTVEVIADVQGWYSTAGSAGSRYVPVNPKRILDTRDGTGAAVRKVGELGVIEVGVTGVAGVPADATAVVLNMTVDAATGPESFLTVWPSGSSMPTASNLNFTSGPASANLVIARVGAGGKVSVFNHVGATDVIADVQGWFAAPSSTSGSSYFPVNPARILDSRTGTGISGGATGQLGTQATIDLTVAGVGGLPTSGITAVVLNVTVADSPGPESFITVFPAGTARPMTSNLNYSAGESVANLVIVRVSNGKVSMYNNVGQTNVIADVQGWFTESS